MILALNQQCMPIVRRVPDRKRPPRCKRGSNCPVDASVQLHCPGCRFAKCLRKDNITRCVPNNQFHLHVSSQIFTFSSFRAGMQLSQVLTPSQRKGRFLSAQRRRQVKVWWMSNVIMLSILLYPGKRSIKFNSLGGEGREQNSGAV